jgi:SpoVK/Ycf46/Vps4 family AAA+-type ATPase
MGLKDMNLLRVLLYGPRLCGKTTFASALFNEFGGNDSGWITVKLVATDVLQDPISVITEAFDGIDRYGVKGLLIDDIDDLFMNLRSSVAAIPLLLEKLEDQKTLQLIVATASNPELLTLRELEAFTDIMPVLYPDEKERLEILKLYVRGCHLHDSVDLEQIAKDTNLWSGGELRQLISCLKIGENLIGSDTVVPCIEQINEHIHVEKRVKRMQELLTFTKEHGNVSSIRQDVLSRHALLLTAKGDASTIESSLINDAVQLHPNIKTLLNRMDDALKRDDHSGVLHSSASIFETLAKEVVGVSSVQDQTLKSFFQRYRKDSRLPDTVLDYIIEIYDSRNRTPLAGHGSTIKPSISRDVAITLAEMTKAFVRIEYLAHANESK